MASMFSHLWSWIHSEKQKHTFVFSIDPQHWEDKDLSIGHSQYHGCWWPGDTRSQGISSHDIDLSKRVNMFHQHVHSGARASAAMILISPEGLTCFISMFIHTRCLPQLMYWFQRFTLWYPHCLLTSANDAWSPSLLSIPHQWDAHDANIYVRQSRKPPSR